MKKSALLDNYIDNPEALFRKTRAKLKKTQQPTSSTSQLEGLSDSEDRPFVRDLTPVFEVMATKTLREFSAPTMENIRTGPAADIDKAFELKPALINMVQANQFCGKAHEDANAHLQHFLEICSTFTIKDVPKDTILFRLFPFSLLGRAK